MVAWTLIRFALAAVLLCLFGQVAHASVTVCGSEIVSGATSPCATFAPSVALTNGATVTPSNPSGPLTFYTLAQANGTNNLIALPSSATVNQEMVFQFTQDATGGSTITFGPGYQFLTGAPQPTCDGTIQPCFTTTANAVNTVDCYVTSATGPVINCEFDALRTEFPFSGLTSGINTSGSFVIGSGSTLAPSGTGTITATTAPPAVTIYTSNTATLTLPIANNTIEEIEQGSPAAITITLNAFLLSPGFKQCVKDGTNNFARYNATIDPSAGATIDGASSFLMNNTHEMACFTYDGSANWMVSGG
jgi:hypothetical protein